jgi:octaprenyl-diphosphate synthase
LISKKLSDLTKPIQEELENFNKEFKNSMKSKVGLVELVTRFILHQKGKKIRPILVLLSAKLAGDIDSRTYRGAILVELLHTATLVHDDVVDNAEQRRGFPSINAVWKNKIAVLMGDYLLARGLMLAVDGSDFDFLKTITNTVKRMSEGELLQTSKTRRLNIDESTYYKIISDKTASFLSACCEVGVRSTTADEEKIAALRDYGEYLGIAFQIRDDILDYVGKASVIGKPLGGDIKEKKITLPLIYALKNGTKEEAKNIIKTIKSSPGSKQINEIIEFVKEKKGIDFAESMSVEYSEKAKGCLSIFPDSEVKTSLIELVDFVVERKN